MKQWKHPRSKPTQRFYQKERIRNKLTSQKDGTHSFKQANITYENYRRNERIHRMEIRKTQK